MSERGKRTDSAAGRGVSAQLFLYCRQHVPLLVRIIRFVSFDAEIPGIVEQGFQNPFTAVGMPAEVTAPRFGIAIGVVKPGPREFARHIEKTPFLRVPVFEFNPPCLPPPVIIRAEVLFVFPVDTDLVLKRQIMFRKTSTKTVKNYSPLHGL